MTTGTLRRIALITLLIGSGVLSATVARRDRLPAVESHRVATSVEPHPDSSLAMRDSLAKVIIARNPFHPERRPLSIRYDPRRPTVIEDVPEPQPVRPTFVLRGIVDARQPRAVIEGFPGKNGAIAVRTGEQVGTFRVEEIAMNRVIIVGADTTWILEVEVPW